MIIKGARTIAEYRQIQAEKIQNWIDSNFVEEFIDLSTTDLQHCEVVKHGKKED